MGEKINAPVKAAKRETTNTAPAAIILGIFSQHGKVIVTGQIHHIFNSRIDNLKRYYQENAQ